MKTTFTDKQMARADKLLEALSSLRLIEPQNPGAPWRIIYQPQLMGGPSDYNATAETTAIQQLLVLDRDDVNAIRLAWAMRIAKI